MTDDATNSQPINDERIGDLRDENKARWIAVSVEILQHDAFAGEPFSKRDAWLWLIANATWKPKRVKHKGKMIDLARGQVLIGRAYLAEIWQWSEQSVRTYLKFLTTECMLEINQSTGHYANVATICNYDKYQTPPTQAGQSANQSATSVQPVSNQTLTSNTNTTNLDSCQIADTSSVAASGPSEIFGLNGSTGLIVESMAHWLNPWAPDYPAAHKSIADACRIYGPTIVRDAFADLKADHADGKVRALTHKAFYGYCRTAKEGRGRKPDAAPVNAKVEAARKSLALIDAKLAEFNA